MISVNTPDGEVEITKVLITDTDNNVVYNYSPSQEDSPVATTDRPSTPIASLRRLAGFLSVMISKKSGRKQAVPTGGIMLIYGKNNVLLAKARWSRKTGQDEDSREIVTIQDKIFSS